MTNQYKMLFGTVLYYLTEEQYGVIVSEQLQFYFTKDDIRGIDKTLKYGDNVSFEYNNKILSDNLLAFKILRYTEPKIERKQKNKKEILRYTEELDQKIVENLAKDCISKLQIVNFNKCLSIHNLSLRSLDIIKSKYPKMKEEDCGEILRAMENILYQDSQPIN